MEQCIFNHAFKQDMVVMPELYSQHHANIQWTLPARACESHPIRAEWGGEGGLKETGAT